MEFRVKIADVAPGGNVFFKMGLLSAKIRLCEEKALTAAARSISNPRTVLAVPNSGRDHVPKAKSPFP